MLSLIGSILSQIFSPLGLTALLLFIALFLIHKHPKTATWLVVIALLIVGVLGNTYFSTFLARSMEWRYLPAQQTPKADAIVLMAGGTQPAQSPRVQVELDGAADRVLYAVRLFKEGAAPLILVTGGFDAVRDTCTLLVQFGVPEEALLRQNKSVSTAEDVRFADVLLDEKDIKQVILVTSALRMDRTAFLFQQEGYEVIPAPTDFSVTVERWNELMRWEPKTIAMNLLPRATNISLSTAVLREYFGLLLHRLSAVL